MRSASVLLGILASCSLIAGAAIQTSKKNSPPPSTESPSSIFANAKSADYIGDEACATCHSSETDHWHKSTHAACSADPALPQDKRGCEGCHGPGKQHQDEEGGHILAFTKMKPADIDQACLRCHQDVMKAKDWHREAHARAGVACTSCHQLHPSQEPASSATKLDHGLLKKAVFPAARETGHLLKSDEATLCATCHRSEVSQFRQNSHHPVPEGRLVCSDCHQLHPTSLADKKLSVIKDKCISCHADKAGPFVYEHDPVAGWMGNGCLECHSPHGSHNPELLKAFSRGLCAQCHTEKLAKHFPGRSCWNAGCHVGLHGSNTDSRFLQK